MSGRDLTPAEFRTQAERAKLKPIMGGLFLEDTSLGGQVSYAAVTVGGRLDYRASLDYALRKRAEHLRLGQQVIKLRAQNKGIDQIARLLDQPADLLLTMEANAKRADELARAAA